MNKTQILVTPQEAVKLSNILQFDIQHIVNDIAIEFQNNQSAEDMQKDPQFYSLWLMSAIWNAGRVQGIREERKKKNVSVSAESSVKTVKIPRLKMMSDYKWQLNCLNDRLEHPEKYADSENVEETIEHLRKWLAEHQAEAEE